MPGGEYVAAEAAVAAALGLRSHEDAHAMVSAQSFGALFPVGTRIKPTLEVLAQGSAKATADAGRDERMVEVSVSLEPRRGDSKGASAAEGAPATFDGGIALVGATTSLAEVRAQLVEQHEESESWRTHGGTHDGASAVAGVFDDDADADDDALDAEEGLVQQLLSSGRFRFLANSRSGGPPRVLKRTQEKLVRGATIADPILCTVKQADLDSKKGGGLEDASLFSQSTERCAERSVLSDASGAHLGGSSGSETHFGRSSESEISSAGSSGCSLDAGSPTAAPAEARQYTPRTAAFVSAVQSAMKVCDAGPSEPSRLGHHVAAAELPTYSLPSSLAILPRSARSQAILPRSAPCFAGARPWHAAGRRSAHHRRRAAQPHPRHRPAPPRLDRLRAAPPLVRQPRAHARRHR